MSRRAFTLTEVLITVTIIAILASAALPQYGKSVERAYWTEAETLLLTIYAGEQVYFTANDRYYAPGMWGTIFMVNPNFAPIPVTFTVVAAGVGGGATTTATATRNGGVCNNLTLTINQARVFGGTWGWPTAVCP